MYANTATALNAKGMERMLTGAAGGDFYAAAVAGSAPPVASDEVIAAARRTADAANKANEAATVATAAATTANKAAADAAKSAAETVAAATKPAASGTQAAAAAMAGNPNPLYAAVAAEVKRQSIGEAFAARHWNADAADACRTTGLARREYLRTCAEREAETRAADGERPLPAELAAWLDTLKD